MSTKITPTERMLNLVIALLGTSRGRSRHYIRANVSGYTPEAKTAAQELTAGAAFERMFERDKDTLRELGVPIITEASYDDDFQEQSLYRIRPQDYRVPEVRLDDSSMLVLAVAASLWNGAAFSDAAASALRKVAARAGIAWSPNLEGVLSRVQTVDTSFEPLWTALRDSHTVAFDYLPSGSHASTRRLVQPWGIGSKYSEWYLVGFDLERGAQRSFRLSRIRSEVSVDTKTPFIRPQAFAISGFLDGLDAQEPSYAVIEVPRDTSHSLRNRQGVRLLPDHPRSDKNSRSDFLSIPYREPELMAREMAAVGPLLRVHEPAQLRSAVRTLLTAALSAQQSGLGSGHGQIQTKGEVVQLRGKKRKDNRDRLVRLLSMVPFLVVNPGLHVEEIAQEFGITEKELAEDLDTLMVSGLPGYQHGDLMDVTTEHGHVFIRDAETLSSPLRLSQEEACALLVGLEAIRVLPESVSAEAWNTAREQLRRVAGPDAWLADVVSLQLVNEIEMAKINRLQLLIKDSGSAAISYVIRSRDELSQRVIEPRRLFSVDSNWYVRAWCQKAQGFRNFRLDQLQSIRPAGGAQNSDRQDTEASDFAPWKSQTALTIQLMTEPATARALAVGFGAEIRELGDAGPTESLAATLHMANLESVAQLLAGLGGKARANANTAQQQELIAWFESALLGYVEDHAVSESSPMSPSQDS